MLDRWIRSVLLDGVRRVCRRRQRDDSTITLTKFATHELEAHGFISGEHLLAALRLLPPDDPIRSRLHQYYGTAIEFKGVWRNMHFIIGVRPCPRNYSPRLKEILDYAKQATVHT